jgi:hypothetical protein
LESLRYSFFLHQLWLRLIHQHTLSITSENRSADGGGVIICGGGSGNVATFTMSGGIISGNNAVCGGQATGGGVRAQTGSIFIMQGGTIAGNSVSGRNLSGAAVCQ